MRPTHLTTSKALIIFTSVVVLVLNAAGNSQYWQLIDGKIQPLDIVQAVGKPVLRMPRLIGDLNDDEKSECLVLTEHKAQITDCKAGILWQSPPTWRILESQIGDLNRDGADEAILLVWRPFQPWPVDRFMPSGGRIDSFHDAKGDSCQIILIGWARNAWREVWAGSALIRPIWQVNAADLDGDGWQELSALESPYDSTAPANALTVWGWLGFGFTLIDRLEGTFQELSIVSDVSNSWLVIK